MLLLDKLTKKEDFSAGEQEIAEFIINLGENIKDYSARSIAKETFTSPATVLKLCKKVGIEGFDNFKKAYTEEIEYINRQFGAINPNIPFTANDNLVKTANKLAALYKETIDDTLSLLHHDLYQKAVNVLEKSDNIHIYSVGTALSIADAFKEKMMKIGKSVYITSNSNYQRYDVFCIGENDCVIFISYSGETKSIVQMARTCVTRKIPFITMTSYGENTLSHLGDAKLYISTRESLRHNIANFSSNLSISFLLDLLYSAYFSVDYEKNMKYKLEVTNRLENNRHSSNPILDDDVE